MIENYFPYIHNDDCTLLTKIDGVSIISINYESAANREAQFIKSLIKVENKEKTNNE